MSKLLRMFSGLAITLLVASPSHVAAQSAGSLLDEIDVGFDGRVRALIVAADRAVLSAEVQARITRLNWREGQRFKKGDVLVRFDCREPQAALGVAKAVLAESQSVLAAKQLRFERKSIGITDLRISETAVARDEARVALETVPTTRCTIRAPYAGRVASRLSQPHETVDIGDELMEIYATDSLELELIVPSVWLRWIKTDQPFKVRVDETGNTYDAAILRLGAAVDPVSQTVRVQAKFTSTTSELLPGMSGQAVFEGAPPS